MDKKVWDLLIKKYFNNAIKVEVLYIVGKQDIDTCNDYRRLKEFNRFVEKIYSSIGLDIGA